jgi:hypothetical protein
VGNHSLHVQSCHTHSKAFALVALCKLLHGAQFGHNYSRTLLAPLVDQNSEAHAAKLHTTHGATESYMDRGINSRKESSKKQVWTKDRLPPPLHHHMLKQKIVSNNKQNTISFAAANPELYNNRFFLLNRSLSRFRDLHTYQQLAHHQAFFCSFKLPLSSSCSCILKLYNLAVTHIWNYYPCLHCPTTSMSAAVPGPVNLLSEKRQKAPSCL